MSQDWNDPRYRSSYTKFGLLGHNGQDFATPVGTPILAPHDGRVIEANYDATGYGYYVKIENDKEGSILGHFKDSPSVNVGDTVKQGQQVGLSGNTGNSTGPHLHWGYYRFPRKRDNGFSGTVDQTHWLGLEDSDKLLQELVEMRASRDKWKLQFSELESKYVKEVQSKDKTIEQLQKAHSELTAQLVSMNESYSDIQNDLKLLREDSVALSEAHGKYMFENEQKLAELNLSLTDSVEKLEKARSKIRKLEGMLEEKLLSYSRWERFWSLFRG